MRFDNPIFDHGFTFPDIADFPDVADEYRNPSDVDGVDIIRKSIQSRDLSSFRNAHLTICGRILNNVDSCIKCNRNM